MLHRRTLGIVVALALVSALAAGMSSCSSGGTGSANVDQNCAINSDCNAPLVCAFARCHNACAASRDCPMGERCVTSGTIGVCQLPNESTCSAPSACHGGQVCGPDQQCREQCTPSVGCTTMGDYCLPSGATNACYATSNPADEPALIMAGILSPDGAILSDASGGPGGPDGSNGDSAGGGPRDGSGGDGDTGPGGNSCPSAQTQFGNVAQGDSNPNFQSGVGARTATDLFAFSGYLGPDPAGDGGGAPIVAVYAQAFDAQTATSKGPMQPLFTARNLSTSGGDAGYGGPWLYSSAVAPTGQIVLVYGVHFVSGIVGYNDTGLYAAFLDSTSDGGTAGLRVQKVVQLETATFYGQPRVVWSNASKAFVMSWWYATSGYFAKVAKFLVDGRTAGGNSDVVPTDNNGAVYGSGGVDQGAAGVSGSLVGVGYVSSVAAGYSPWLTVLDPTGSRVGSSFQAAYSPGLGNWVAVAGTAGGFVYFYDSIAPAGVAEVFVPTPGDAGVVGASSDGGDAGTFPGFLLPGTLRAVAGRAVNDDMGGIGGVGLALLYSNGVSFTYVNPDGTSQVGLNSVFAHAYASGDEVSMTNLNGSFVVSLYSQTNHSTKVAASGCM